MKDKTFYFYITLLISVVIISGCKESEVDWSSLGKFVPGCDAPGNGVINNPHCDDDDENDDEDEEFILGRMWYVGGGNNTGKQSAVWSSFDGEIWEETGNIPEPQAHGRLANFKGKLW